MLLTARLASSICLALTALILACSNKSLPQLEIDPASDWKPQAALVSVPKRFSSTANLSDYDARAVLKVSFPQPLPTKSIEILIQAHDGANRIATREGGCTDEVGLEVVKFGDGVIESFKFDKDSVLRPASKIECRGNLMRLHEAPNGQVFLLLAFRSMPSTLTLKFVLKE